jgi:hypothetical protein
MRPLRGSSATIFLPLTFLCERLEVIVPLNYSSEFTSFCTIVRSIELLHLIYFPETSTDSNWEDINNITHYPSSARLPQVTCCKIIVPASDRSEFGRRGSVEIGYCRRLVWHSWLPLCGHGVGGDKARRLLSFVDDKSLQTTSMTFRGSSPGQSTGHVNIGTCSWLQSTPRQHPPKPDVWLQPMPSTERCVESRVLCID